MGVDTSDFENDDPPPQLLDLHNLGKQMRKKKKRER